MLSKVTVVSALASIYIGGLLCADTIECFEVSVRFDVVEFGYATQPPTVRSNRFAFVADCIVAGEQWFIRSEFTRNAVEYFVCDGTNVYRTFRHKKDAATSLTNATVRAQLGLSPRLTTDTGFITIIPGRHPLGDLGANLPWLAYCSGSYLENTNNLIPIPGDSIRHSPAALGYIARTERFAEAPRLPSRVELRASESLMASSARRPLLIRSKAKAATRTHPSHFAASIKDGLLQCEYRVTGTTNLNGLIIPTDFRMVQYAPSKTASLKPRMEVTGKLIALRPATSIPQWPIYSDATNYMVTDLRFRDEAKLLDAITYRTGDPDILPTNTPALQGAFALALAAAPEDPADKAWPKSFVVSFILLLLVTPAVWLFYRGARRHPL